MSDGLRDAGILEDNGVSRHKSLDKESQSALKRESHMGTESNKWTIKSVSGEHVVVKADLFKFEKEGLKFINNSNGEEEVVACFNVFQYFRKS